MLTYNYWFGFWHKLRGHTIAATTTEVGCSCGTRWHRPPWWDAPW